MTATAPPLRVSHLDEEGSSGSEDMIGGEHSVVQEEHDYSSSHPSKKLLVTKTLNTNMIFDNHQEERLK